MRLVLALLGVVLTFPITSQALGQTSSETPAQAWTQGPLRDVPSPQLTTSTRSRYSVGGFIGYQGGLSFQAFALARDFAQGFPLQARFRLARNSVEPGSAPDAR